MPNTPNPASTPSSVHFRETEASRHTADQHSASSHAQQQHSRQSHRHDHHPRQSQRRNNPSSQQSTQLSPQQNQALNGSDQGVQRRVGRSDALPIRERDRDDISNRKPIPTRIVPLYRQRLVLVKIADSFLRIGSRDRPIVSRLRPPLHPHREDDVMAFINSRGKRFPYTLGSLKKQDNFNFKDFTFMADESCTITESWYRNARCFYHIRFCLKRKPENGGIIGDKMEYLCAVKTPNGQFEIQYDRRAFGSWWRITAVSENQYVAESVQFPGRCMMRDHLNNLALSSPISNKDRGNLARGVWDSDRTITIITLPDFAVWHPGVQVN